MITSAVSCATLIDSRGHELNIVLPPDPLWTDATRSDYLSFWPTF